LEQRLEKIAHATAATFNCEVDVAYHRGCPPTVNASEQVDIALVATREAMGDDQVIENIQPLSGSEDLFCMLKKVPGCYVFIGNDMTGRIRPCAEIRFQR